MRAEITRNMEKIMHTTTASEKIHDMLLNELSILFEAHELSNDIYWSDVELTLEDIVEKLMAKCHSRNEAVLRIGLHQIQAKETLMELIEERELDYWRRHDDDEGISEEMLKGIERSLETGIPRDFEWFLSTFGHIQSPNLVVMGLYRGEKNEWEFPLVEETLRLRNEGLPVNHLAFGQTFDKIMVIDEFNNLFEWENGQLWNLNIKLIPFLTNFLELEKEKELEKMVRDIEVSRKIRETIENQFEVLDFLSLDDGKIKERGLIKFSYQGKIYYSTLTMHIGNTMDDRTPYLHHELVFPGDSYTEKELLVITNEILNRSQYRKVRMGYGLMMKGIVGYLGIEHECLHIVIRRMETVGLPEIKLTIGDKQIEWIFGAPVDNQLYKKIKMGKIDY